MLSLMGNFNKFKLTESLTGVLSKVLNLIEACDDEVGDEDESLE